MTPQTPPPSSERTDGIHFARGDSVRLELYVRSLAPTGCRSGQEGIVERLAQLESSGQIEEYTVDIWGRQLSLDGSPRTEPEARIRERIELFQSWARTHDRSLDRFFPVDTVRSELTGEEYTCVRVPVMTLAEYEAERLRFVTPSTDGETTHTVADHIEAIEAADVGRVAAQRGEVR